MSLARCFLLFLASVAVFTAACGEPPEKEMQQARAAIEDARAGGAERYAREEFTAAVDALTRAESAATERDFRLALNNALDSRARAQVAAGEARARKAEALAGAQRALTEVTTLLEKTQTQLKAVEGARVPARTLAPIRTAISDGERQLQEARSALQREDYDATALSARAARATLTKVSGDLGAASPPPARRRPARGR